jgi:Flp pilus assembly protein TadG
MKRFGIPSMCRFLKSQKGQSAVVVMITASAMMALSAASVETGHVYFAYQQLVASTNAAVLAGAQAMPNTTLASQNVTKYSAQSNGLNTSPWLQNAAATPAFLCLSTVSNSLNVPCQTASGGTGGYNSLSVTQTATIPLWFGGLVGMKKMNVSYTAKAAMAGGQNEPWNIAVILDATPSMDYQDNGVQCNGTQLSCAKLGIQALLSDLYPCGLGETCTNAGATPVDSVSLFVFPAVTSGTVYKDSTCFQGTPTPVAYTFPNPPSNTALPSADTYQVVPWANDYMTSDTATSLNTSSHMVIAAGAGGCTGLSTRYEWTYYPQTIYAAQAALQTEQANNPYSQNAMIILGDGDLNACASNANTTAGACNTSPLSLIALEGTLNGTGTHSSNPTGYQSYAYPSALGECGQAVLAAQAAAALGTTVYTIGYGSPVSGSCNTDRTYSASVTTNGGTWGPGKQGCDALKAMASAGVNFYSDDAQGCQATAPSNQALTKLTAIFRAITNKLKRPRLVPNGTT